MNSRIGRWLYEHTPNPVRTEVPRWVLFPFAVMPLSLAYWYTTSPALRFSSPSFGAAKALAGGSMQPWGLVWLAIGLVITLGVLLRRPPYRFRGITITGLLFGGVMSAWWAAVYSAQAIVNDAAAPTGGGVWGFISTVYVLAAVYVASAGRG